MGLDDRLRPRRLSEDHGISVLLERVADLPAAAQEVADGVVASAVHADTLVEEALRMERGDAAAGERLRAQLLAVFDEADFSVLARMPTLAPGTPISESARTAARALMIGAVAGAHDDYEAQRMLSAAVYLLAPVGWAATAALVPASSTALRSFMLTAPPALPSVRSQFGGQLPGLPDLDWTGRRPGLPDVGRRPWQIPDFPVDIIPKKGPVIVFDPEQPGGIRLDVPIWIEPCVIQGAANIGKVKSQSPHWEIDEIAPENGCPGSVAKLRGHGFGTSGKVLFPDGDEQVEATDVPSWSDTEIRVRVPAVATPGDIMLDVPAGTANMCGIPWPVSRSGKSLVRFRGGLPRITRFVVLSSGDLVPPDTDAEIDLAFTAAEGTSAIIRITRGGDEVQRHENITAPFTRVRFHTQTASTPQIFDVEAVVRNGCGTVTAEARIVVGVRPQLSIAGVELIQGVQRPSPIGSQATGDLPLVAQRTTAVRIYVESGLPPGFSYGSDPSSVPISASVRLGNGETFVAMALATAAISASRDNAVIVEIPWDRCVGSVPLDIRVWTETPVLANDRGMAVALRTAVFQPRRILPIMLFRVRDDRKGLPEPSLQQCLDDVSNAHDRLPIRVGGLRVMGAFHNVALPTTRDLTDRDEWAELLDDLDDIADGWQDNGGVWAAEVQDDPSYAINGIAHAAFDRIWPLDDDARAMVVRTGLRASFPHELTHALGQHHSYSSLFPASNVKNIDGTLPGSLEDDAIGWSFADGSVFAPPWPDLMSYGSPDPTLGGYQDRWPSAELWRRLFDRLN